MVPNNYQQIGNSPLNMTYYPQQQVPLAQMPVQQVQRTYLNGKYIANETDILPAEIPMDGNRSYFPSADENYILVKFWDSNGKIVTRKYVLEDSPQEIKPDIYETLNSMQSKLDEVKGILTRNKPPFNKKEGGQNV